MYMYVQMYTIKAVIIDVVHVHVHTHHELVTGYTYCIRFTALIYMYIGKAQY